MDEFAALAQRVVLTMDDVRGCLVLSRDGLVLGAFPEDQEAELKPAWLRFVNVGEARKGFVEFSDQLWAFVHRGPYAAFVVTGTSVRPGVMLDQLEQAVITAEETRAKQKEVTLKVPDAASAPVRSPTDLAASTGRSPGDRARSAAPRRPRPRRCRTSPRRSASPTKRLPSPPGRAPIRRSSSRCRRCRNRWRRCRPSCSSSRLQQSPPSESPAPAPPAAAPAPAPAGSQQLSGYRRPESAAPPTGRSRGAATAPRRRPVRTRSSFGRGVALRGRARRRAVGGPLQLGILAVREAGGRAGGGRGGVGGRRARRGRWHLPAGAAAPRLAAGRPPRQPPPPSRRRSRGRSIA